MARREKMINRFRTNDWDFDGDGYQDLAIGSLTEDLAGKDNGGKVAVFFVLVTATIKRKLRNTIK